MLLLLLLLLSFLLLGLSFVFRFPVVHVVVVFSEFIVIVAAVVSSTSVLLVAVCGGGVVRIPIELFYNEYVLFFLLFSISVSSLLKLYSIVVVLVYENVRAGGIHTKL